VQLQVLRFSQSCPLGWDAVWWNEYERNVVTSSRLLWLCYPDDKDTMILWNAGRDLSNNLITSQKTIFNMATGICLIYSGWASKLRYSNIYKFTLCDA